MISVAGAEPEMLLVSGVIVSFGITWLLAAVAGKLSRFDDPNMRWPY